MKFVEGNARIKIDHCSRGVHLEISPADEEPVVYHMTADQARQVSRWFRTAARNAAAGFPAPSVVTVDLPTVGNA